MKRSYYSNSIAEFLLEDDTKILGALSLHHHHDLEGLQKNAWLKQIQILKDTLRNFDQGTIYFEFSIPRMGKRVDNILIIKDLIFVIEFKVGDADYQKHGLDQVVDYCLDLKNFHEGSHHAKLIPVLVATRAGIEKPVFEVTDNLYEPLKANGNNLGDIIRTTLFEASDLTIDPETWENSIYKPTPTIIQAAQALYKGHNVKEISRHDAGAKNLAETTNCINRIIDDSKQNLKKSICFLTGVPGAGKTLAGLNIAIEREKKDIEEHAVFLSGNGPLVQVLREALIRDTVETAKGTKEKVTKKSGTGRAVKFIQNIHHFRDEYLKPTKAPIEKVVVFDEAQRAWSMEQVRGFMKRKKGILDFDMSEPEFLISVMDRHEDWCTIVCLIGGGQEINTGEAGVSEWLTALKNRFSKWEVHYSNLITNDTNYLSDEGLIKWVKNNGLEEQDLHLAVNLRSYRSEKTSALVHEILEGNTVASKKLFTEVQKTFPIFLTRDIIKSRKWLRKQSKGTERIGIVGSSGGKRLRPLGIDVNNNISAPDWFLNDSNDVRSSIYLEDVATEFDIQGLEIDWICMAWDINFYYDNGQWKYQKFSGTSWKKINNANDRSYLQNAYRVLLTRARQGIVIFVPEGNDLDHTRPRKLYDQTFQYLKACGIPEL